jgi:hypothetical protein
VQCRGDERYRAHASRGCPEKKGCRNLRVHREGIRIFPLRYGKHCSGKLRACVPPVHAYRPRKVSPGTL